MKTYLPSNLRLTKDKDKFECYLRGMANALYIYATLNKIEDITWDICYEIAWDTIFYLNWQYIDVDNYLEFVEHLNEIQPQFGHDIFSILTDKKALCKFKYRAENKRAMYYDKLTLRDKLLIEKQILKKYEYQFFNYQPTEELQKESTEDFINTLLEED